MRLSARKPSRVPVIALDTARLTSTVSYRAGTIPARLLSLKSAVQFGVTVGAGHFNRLEVPEQVNPMIERLMRSL